MKKNIEALAKLGEETVREKLACELVITRLKLRDFPADGSVARLRILAKNYFGEYIAMKENYTKKYGLNFEIEDLQVKSSLKEHGIEDIYQELMEA